MPGKLSDPARKRLTATSSAAMRAAVARGPARPASRAMARAGKRRLVDRLEGQARRPSSRLDRRGRRRHAARVGQGVLDRETHVGQSELCLERAVHELDGGVDDALRVDDHGDAIVRDIVQPVRLDDLQALVHEGGRVDRDLGSHVPGGVGQRLGRTHRLEVGRPVAERSARGGQDQPGDLTAALRRRGTARSPSAPNRSAAASRVGWPASPARRRPRPPRRASGITRWPPATSVSLLAVATILPAASAASVAGRLTRPPVATTTRSTSSRVAMARSGSGARSSRHARRQVASARVRHRPPPAGGNASACGAERRRIAAGGQGDHLEPIRAAPPGPRAPAGRSTRSSPGPRRRRSVDATGADSPAPSGRHPAPA